MRARFYKSAPSGKSAWVGVKTIGTFNYELVVMPMDDVKYLTGSANPKKGDEFELPDNLKRAPLQIYNADTEEYETATTNDGEIIHCLVPA